MTFADEAQSANQVIGLAATFSRPYATATRWPMPELVAVSCSAGRSQRNSEATLRLLSMPSDLRHGDDVQVEMTINGAGTLLYRGDFLDGGWSFDGGRSVELRCRGISGRLGRPWGGPERVYDALLTEAERQDGAVIRNLIEAVGIPSSRHQIEDSVLLLADGTPSVWLVGQIQAVVLPNGTPPIQLIDQIDAVVGYQTYDQLPGYIHRFEVSPAGAKQTPDHVFAEGQRGVRISRTRAASAEIINKWLCQGLTYQSVILEYEASDASAILDAMVAPELRPFYNGATFQSDLMETPIRVQRTAEQKLSFTNRAQDGFEIELETARPDVLLGGTIQFTYPSIGVSSAARVMVEQIRIDVDLESGNASTVVTTNGGTLATNSEVAA